jgi:hypothetical protein
MGILTTLVWACLNLVCSGIDILVFFVVVRILVSWRSVNWLDMFDSAGGQLVNAFLGSVRGLWLRLTGRVLITRGQLAIGLVSLVLARSVVASIARTL